MGNPNPDERPAMPAWVRSALITAVSTFALAITATGFEFTKSAILAAAITAARTALSAALPGGPFGVKPTPADAPVEDFDPALLDDIGGGA